MERKYNGFYKAVSILCLIAAIGATLIFLASIGVLIHGINEPITIHVMDEYGSMVEELVQPETLATYLMSVAITTAAYLTLNYCAWECFKKYSVMTEEEAQENRNKIIAWIVVFFVFNGLLIAILSLVGFLRKNDQSPVVEENGEPVENVPAKEEQPVGVETKKKESADNVDKMMERLDKLNRLKEMGAITDAEYEKLRQTIVSKM